jgi:hypothetical protein
VVDSRYTILKVGALGLLLLQLPLDPSSSHVVTAGGRLGVTTLCPGTSSSAVFFRKLTRAISILHHHQFFNPKKRGKERRKKRKKMGVRERERERFSSPGRKKFSAVAQRQTTFTQFVAKKPSGLCTYKTHTHTYTQLSVQSSSAQGELMGPPQATLQSWLSVQIPLTD